MISVIVNQHSSKLVVTDYSLINILIIRITVGCIKSSSKYFMHIQSEEQVQQYIEWGMNDTTWATTIDCHWKIMWSWVKEENMTLRTKNYWLVNSLQGIALCWVV
jgi:hypothetical protein